LLEHFNQARVLVVGFDSRRFPSVETIDNPGRPEVGENERQKEIRMKAKVELVIRDEDGNILSQLDPYVLELGSQSLHDIEGMRKLETENPT